MIQAKWMLPVAVLLAVVGCDKAPGEPTGKVTAADVKRDVAQADKTTAAYAAQTKEEYQLQLETRLKVVDAEMAALREKNRNLKDEAKADWDRTLPQLQAKRDSAHDKLAEVRRSSGEAWKDIKKGAQSAWDEMDGAFRDAAKRF
jgi:hypothetical protein